MIVLPDRIRDAAIVALEKLAKRDDMPKDAAMELQIAAGVLGYARHLTESGAPTIRTHCEEAAVWLDQLANGTTRHEVSNDIRQTIIALQTEAGAIADSRIGSDELHNRFASFLSKTDQFFMDFAQHAQEVSQALLSELAAPMMAWQTSLNALSQVSAVRENRPHETRLSNGKTCKHCCGCA